MKKKSHFTPLFLMLLCFGMFSIFGPSSFAETEEETLKKLPNLFKNLKNKDTFKRREAISQLVTLGENYYPETIPAFITALRDTDEVTRGEAAEGLAKIGSSAVQSIINILSTEKFKFTGR